MAVAPLPETLVSQHPLGLQHQQAAGFEAAPEPVQHGARGGDVLYHLGTGDEVILPRQQLGPVGIELVVTRHLKARLPPHGDEGRPGTAAEIEAAGRRAHPGEHLTEGAHQKAAITGIVHLVVVPVIDRLLGLIVQVIRLIQPDQLARQATVIALARHRQGVAVASRAEGAAGA
ncbi:hypothetical protein D3C76_841120 [compost metagenome]